MELHADQALQTHLLVVVLEVDGQASIDIVSQTFALGHDFVAVPLCDVDFRGGHGLAHNGGLARGRINHDGSAALRDYASAGAFRVQHGAVLSFGVDVGLVAPQSPLFWLQTLGAVHHARVVGTFDLAVVTEFEIFELSGRQKVP